MPNAIQVLHEEARFRVGVSRSLVIGAWPGPAEPPDLDVFRRAEEKALESIDRLSLIIALKLHTGGIEPEMRAKGEALQRDFADVLVGQAVVLVGSGFVASTIRAFASGLNLLSRARVRTGTFGEATAGLEWLAALKHQQPVDAEHLRSLRDAVAAFTTDLHT